jgi:hypothetical protein
MSLDKSVEWQRANYRSNGQPVTIAMSAGKRMIPFKVKPTPRRQIAVLQK